MRNEYLSNILHTQWRGNLRAATSRLNIGRLPRSNCTGNYNNVSALSLLRYLMQLHYDNRTLVIGINYY